MDGQQQLEYLKQQRKDVLDKVFKDDENLETHFVENPYIKMRERANQNSKNLLDEKKLTGDDEQLIDQDIYVQKEDGKLIIKDFEEMDSKDQDRKKKRRTEGYGVDSDTDSDDETAAASKKGAAVSSNALKKIIKNQKSS